MDRRGFLKTAALGTAAAAISAASPRTFTGSSETLVTTLFNSLTPEQKPKIVFPFDHPLRSKVDNNWHIVPQKIGAFFTPDQQAMINEIFRGLHNPDFVNKVIAHMEEDTKGVGLADYSVALFGEPGAGAFEFVLTGRHCTARCDGDSVQGAAFGGPIFYGHQAGPTFEEKPDHPNNVYWYQAKRANEVFNALSGKQREQALRSDPRAEKATDTIALKPKSELAGLPVADMSKDQKRLVEKVLADLLMPFRKKDIDEAMRYIKGSGGVDSLHMSFYKNLDIGHDGVWDVWQLESPNMVWYFRGAPHVHTWVNIRAKA
ncbi:MAG TPA: DUF3500 domain-containing protein [Bryobacteraceae bacterium]|nr:DUF3500 domain-containing protein [Bryobacteraceae bacterium]